VFWATVRSHRLRVALRDPSPARLSRTIPSAVVKQCDATAVAAPSATPSSANGALLQLGSANNTVVNSGGDLILYGPAILTSTNIQPGGFVDVEDGYVMSNCLISSTGLGADFGGIVR
jgi:autotransporter passenger strand-loop-strand repeat protein